MGCGLTPTITYLDVVLSLDSFEPNQGSNHDTIISGIIIFVLKAKNTNIRFCLKLQAHVITQFIFGF